MVECSCQLILVYDDTQRVQGHHLGSVNKTIGHSLIDLKKHLFIPKYATLALTVQESLAAECGCSLRVTLS